MSRARAPASETDLDRGELDEIADELYALRTDEFATARDERVRRARADGQQALARELGRLRRPTQSAWLINLLWRDQRDALEELLQLADELNRAQAQASREELQRLTSLRRGLESALIQRARGLAQKAGVNVTATMEREAQDTLAAALADPDVADEVRTGRLVKPASYAGFGPLPSGASRGVEVARSAVPAASPKPKEALRGKADEATRKRREAAERRIREARSAVDAAAAELAKWSQSAAAAQAQHDEVRASVEQLREQLRDLESQVASTQQAAAAAGQRREQAAKAHEAATRTLERAEQDLEA